MLAWIPTCRERELITKRTVKFFLSWFACFGFDFPEKFSFNCFLCLSKPFGCLLTFFVIMLERLNRKTYFFLNESVRKCFLGPGKRTLCYAEGNSQQLTGDLCIFLPLFISLCSERKVSTVSFFSL